VGTLGIQEHTVEIDGKTITFEAGKLAAQAGGAVITSVGDTKVLTTTTASAGPKDFLPFFPLTIEVEERMYANGRIPGSFFKREGRPSENAILVCRLTDRPLRPTFVEGLRNEVQVVNTILQTTQDDPYDVVAMNGSSLSTMLSGLPFEGPVSSVRYAMLRDGSWTAFPSFQELEDEAVFDMVVAGRVEEDGEVAILMIEAEATADSWTKIDMGATAPTEQVVGQAIEDVKPIIKQLCEAQQAFVDQVGIRDAGEFPLFLSHSDEVFDLVFDAAADKVEDVYRQAELGKAEKDERSPRSVRRPSARRGERPRGPRRRGARQAGQGGVPHHREEGRPPPDRRRRHPCRRPWRDRPARGHRRRRRPAQDPRLQPLPARRDPGHVRARARHDA
jgi:polyribonucleotide nucleotidyltransferase